MHRGQGQGQGQSHDLGSSSCPRARGQFSRTPSLTECRWFYPGNDLRHSAPSHRAKVTQQFLRQNTLDFIAADKWASYSPDLNPLDYCIWDILQDFVYTRADDFRLQIYRTSNRQSKTNGRRSPLRQLKIHCTTEKQLNAVRKQIVREPTEV